MSYSDNDAILAEKEVRRILKQGKKPNIARIVSKYGLSGPDFVWLEGMIEEG